MSAAGMLAATSSQALWFASRGTGVVCLVLLTASVLLGIVTTARLETRGWPRFVIEGLHRNISLLVVVFLTVHVVTTVVDGFAPIGFLDSVLPFASPYRRFWLGLGAVAADLLLALVISSLIRSRLGYRVWKVIHWAAYACWPVALLHGIETGSDRHERWMIAVDAIAVTLVVAASAWRFAARDRLRFTPLVTPSTPSRRPVTSKAGRSR